MSVVQSKIIAPDSSHWAKWIDAALSKDPGRREQARGLERSLLEAGRTPLICWHHLEELLSIEDEALARDRIAFIQQLTFVAFLRLPSDDVGLGGVTDVLASELIAASEGMMNPLSVRDAARQMLMKVGSGADAIGEEELVWRAARSEFIARNSQARELIALTSYRFFDDQRTIGEISKGAIRPPSDLVAKSKDVHAALLSNIREHGDRRITNADVIADKFMGGVMAWVPPAGMSVRDLLVTALTAQGVEEEEISDDQTLADLNALALFRSKVRVVAPKTGMPFEALKRIQMDMLPSWLIEHGLKTYGQQRNERKGSDLNDAYLATLAPYVDELYVDKRTAEDFRRAFRKMPVLAELVGEISRTPNYLDLARITSP